MNDKPAWLLALPTCKADGRPARYVPPSPDERRRGVVAVWFDENHPYTNPKNPGSVGSAMFVKSHQISY